MVILKGNRYLEKSLITGILKVSKASLFSDLNNVKVRSMLKDNRYGEYFGFTVTETDDLLDRAGLAKKAHKLKEMYNGYQIGVILELKAADNSKEDLGQLAGVALSQIAQKSYCKDMQAHGISKVLGVGIAFFEKEVRMEYDMISS